MYGAVYGEHGEYGEYGECECNIKTSINIDFATTVVDISIKKYIKRRQQSCLLERILIGYAILLGSIRQREGQIQMHPNSVLEHIRI